MGFRPDFPSSTDSKVDLAETLTLVVDECFQEPVEVTGWLFFVMLAYFFLFFFAPGRGLGRDVLFLLLFLLLLLLLLLLRWCAGRESESVRLREKNMTWA